VLARSCSCPGASCCTSGQPFSVTSHTLALSASKSLVFTVVVSMAVEVHGFITFQLFALELSSVWLGTPLKLGELLSCSLLQTTTLLSKLFQSFSW